MGRRVMMCAHEGADRGRVAVECMFSVSRGWLPSRLYASSYASLRLQLACADPGQIMRGTDGTTRREAKGPPPIIPPGWRSS